MPQLAIDPGDTGDEAVGLDCAQHLAGLGIDLMDQELITRVAHQSRQSNELEQAGRG